MHDIPGAPRGAYWDGGITDYHLHLDYALACAASGLVLYPHFQKTVIPGWLDKALKHRHRATAHLDNVVVLSPRPEWIATLPNAKLPDRNDFKHYRRRPRRPRRRLEPRAARERAPGATSSRRSSARASRSRRCRWPETTIDAQIERNKSEKGNMVMTPRTTGFFTEA